LNQANSKARFIDDLADPVAIFFDVALRVTENDFFVARKLPILFYGQEAIFKPAKIFMA
jgi:hypothetical protein